MKISGLLAMVMSFVLLIQSSAWGYGSKTSQAAVLQKYIEQFNGLSQKEKNKEIQSFLAFLSEKDQSYLKTIIGNQELKIPDFEVIERGLKTRIEGKEIQVTHKKDFLFTINGKVFDFGEGKWEHTLTSLDVHLTEQRFSFLELFISQAHAQDKAKLMANFMSVLAVIATVATILIAFEVVFVALVLEASIAGLAAAGLFASVGSAFSFHASGSRNIQAVCDTARYHVDAIKANSSAQELGQAKKDIGRILIDLHNSPECNFTRKRLCDQVRSCLVSLENEISAVSGINSGERSDVKDQEKTSNRPSSGISQQPQ